MQRVMPPLLLVLPCYFYLFVLSAAWCVQRLL